MSKKLNRKNNVNTKALTKLFASFTNGLRAKKALKPKQFLESKKLDYNKLEIGFNSGQFHHRKTEEFREPFIKENILTKSNAPVNAPGRVAYSVFAKDSVVFPLKDKNEKIVNFFATRVKLAQPISLYLNEHGVYPHYPYTNAKRLFLTHDVYDAATILQSNALKNEDAVIALKNGELTDDIIVAITSINSLKSIQVISKNEQTELAQKLKELTPARVATILLPTGKNLNDVYCSENAEAVIELLNKNDEKFDVEIDSDANKEKVKIDTDESFTVIHNQHFKYTSDIATFEVKGKLPKDLGSMKVSIKAHYIESNKKERFSIDLFKTDKIEKHAENALAKYGVNANSIVRDLTSLSEALEAHRDEQMLPTFSNDESDMVESLTPTDRLKALNFLKTDNLFERIDKQLEKTGVVGEERTRMLLFVVATSLISKQPLHAIVQASSGTGKSHLVNAVRACIPQSMCINATTITSKGLYNFQGHELINKLFVIQDLDGLNESALLAFRELQSAKNTSNVISKKQNGDHVSGAKQVNANFSSLSATTKQDVYFDNQSRSIIVGVDESNEQSRRIIENSNRFYAGLIDKSKQEEAKFFLQNCIKVLASCDVVNPFATQLQLPTKAKMQRRLNHQFQEFILQVTRLHQFQREKDSSGRLITTVEDIRIAIELFFDAIILKIDELSSSTRQFFEELKKYVASAECKSTSGEFKQKEIRDAMSLQKTQVAHHLKVLIDLEYVAKVGGSANRGYTYKITYADNNNKMQKEVKDFMLSQVDSFTKPNTESL